ncbi:MAG: DUF2268 domain-containing putative Zn-dependent protease [Hominenteromicrobium sp.]
MEEIWEKEVIVPFWEKLCCYAPFDLSARKPGVIRDLDTLDRPETEMQALWVQKYRAAAAEHDVDYETYMFGSEEAGIPWCAGYAVGFYLVHNYLKTHRKTVREILETNPKAMLPPL